MLLSMPLLTMFKCRLEYSSASVCECGYTHALHSGMHAYTWVCGWWCVCVWCVCVTPTHTPPPPLVPRMIQVIPVMHSKPPRCGTVQTLDSPHPPPLSLHLPF